MKSKGVRMKMSEEKVSLRKAILKEENEGDGGEEGDKKK